MYPFYITITFVYEASYFVTDHYYICCYDNDSLATV